MTKAGREGDEDSGGYVYCAGGEAWYLSRWRRRVASRDK